MAPRKVRDVPECQGCPMRNLLPDNTFVAPKMPTRGRDLVRLMIGEAPGEEEAIKGEPFVGGAGSWLNSMLKAARIDREGLTIANCIQCRPPNNFFPTDSKARSYMGKPAAEETVAHCYKAHVEPLLKGRPWKRIDLLGDKALSIVAGKDGVQAYRGSPLKLEQLGDKYIAMATLHPAAIMRDQTSFPYCANDLTKSLEPPPEYYDIYPSIEAVKQFNAKEFAFDIESNPATGEIYMVGLCARPTWAIVVPFRGAYVAELRRIFSNATAVIGQNIIQFDLPMLARDGVKIPDTTQVWDIMLLQHLLFPDFPHDLEFIGSQFVSKPAWKGEDRTQQNYWPLRCARDTDVTLQCFKPLLENLGKWKLVDLYRDVQVPLARICRLMHDTGIKVDANNLRTVREKLIVERDDLEQWLPEELRTQRKPIRKREPAPAGTKGKSGKPVKFVMVESSKQVVPWRSPAIKQKYLYSKDEPWCLGLEPILDYKTEKVTTGKIALDKIYARTKNKAVQTVRKLNALDELITTFCKEDNANVDKMYPHFNVHGTSSGRLSSSAPNLQNIPESTRYIYVPSRPGWKIVNVDYSQIENRLTAFFAGDTERLRRFELDPKFSEHKHAASLFFDIPYDDVVKDNSKDAPYGKAKRIVHMTNYGGGYRKIANMYDMDLKETRILQDKWKHAIKPTTLWQQRCAETAKQQTFLRSPFGRYRWFWTSSLYTESLSFLPQSAAADIIFRAMLGLMYKKINWPEALARKVCPIVEAVPDEANLLVQVHDSLVFECPEGTVAELVRILRRVMQQSWPELKGFSIPISVETGDSWGECTPYMETI